MQSHPQGDLRSQVWLVLLIPDKKPLYIDCTENEYADGVINQPRTWGVGRSEYYNHFSSATKNLLQKEEQVRKPILRRVKMY